MLTFDTNILVYATAPQALEKGSRARDLVAHGLRSTSTILLLQTLSEFSNIALRKEGMPVVAILRLIEAWQALLPVHAAEEADLIPALGAFAVTVCHSGMPCCGQPRGASACVIS